MTEKANTTGSNLSEEELAMQEHAMRGDEQHYARFDSGLGLPEGFEVVHVDRVAEAKPAHGRSYGDGREIHLSPYPVDKVAGPGIGPTHQAPAHGHRQDNLDKFNTPEVHLVSHPVDRIA